MVAAQFIGHSRDYRNRILLGSGLAISMGGPAVLLAYILAAGGTYVVFDALARMTAEHPEQGSFRSYAKKAFGSWAGFGSGWVYWFSELLIMGSQLTALSIFSRFWFPAVPMWVFAAGFAAVSLLIVFFGNKGFDRVENILAVIKVAAILMFLVIAAALLAGWIGGGSSHRRYPLGIRHCFRQEVSDYGRPLFLLFMLTAALRCWGLCLTGSRNLRRLQRRGRSCCSDWLGCMSCRSDLR